MQLTEASLYLSIVVTILMLVINGIFCFTEKDLRNLHTLEFWFAYFAYFLVSMVTQGMAPEIVAFSTLVWIWRTKAICSILGDISGKSLFKSWYIHLALLGYISGVILFVTGAGFTYFTLPPAIANFMIGIDLILQTNKALKEKGTARAPHKIILFVVLVISLHLLDYPFIRYDHVLTHYGFLVVLITTLMMAIILPAVSILDREHEHKRSLEKTIELRVQQLKNEVKFSALGQMTAGIVHEINDPLSLITHQTNELRHKIYKNEAERETLMRGLSRIEATSERMAKVVNSLKKFSRDSKSAPIQNVPVATIVEDTLSYCVDLFSSAGILLDVEPYPVKTIECRSIQISQVLLNLLNNSFEAIQGKRFPWIKISFEERPDKILIRVCDSGDGISPEIKYKMFEPFFTTKVTGGNGLGLSVSKGIIEDHGGKIYYDDASINTSFIVELPYRQSLK